MTTNNKGIDISKTGGARPRGGGHLLDVPFEAHYRSAKKKEATKSQNIAWILGKSYNLGE
jgi:hypothetical protein